MHTDAPLHVPLQQSPHFARALNAYGTDVTLWNGQDTAPVILQKRFKGLGTLAFASRVDPDVVKDTSVRLINGETPCPRPYRKAGFTQILTPAHVAEWDLTQPDLRRGMHGKWRNRLKQAERHHLRIREAAWDGHAHPMFAANDQLARARRFRPYPTALLSVFAQINAGDGVIFEAYDCGTLVAACLVLRHGRVATYQTAWTSPRGRALGASRVVLWAAACQLVTLGYEVFDLGVIDTQNARGLARFKLGTEATLRPLGGTWARFRTGKPRV